MNRTLDVGEMVDQISDRQRLTIDHHHPATEQLIARRLLGCL